MIKLIHTGLRMKQMAKRLRRGIYKDLIQKEAHMAIIGLNYRGWSLLHQFSKDFNVVVFDTNPNRISLAQRGVNPFDLSYCPNHPLPNTYFSHQEEDIAQARFYIITAQSYIDENYRQNLNSLRASSYCLGRVLKKRDFVVFENSYYPGCIEEVCIPILEETSNLKFNKDFKVGFSPETYCSNKPAFLKFGLFDKLVSGGDNSSTNQISDVYNHIIPKGVHKSSSIRLAEILKVIDRKQDDLGNSRINYA